jgi:hypothetical protein
MSGGSFNYLCHAAGDAAELAVRRQELEDMAIALEALDDGKAAARATRDVIRALATVDRLSADLDGPWQALEWWYSNDYSKRQAHEALAEWNAEHGAEGDRRLSAVALEEEGDR